MLKKLIVKDFALIDDLEIEFRPGLTAITGETGSGKSILLESLALLFGKRADSDYVRYGKDKAVVSADFVLDEALAISRGIPSSIHLLREVEKDGRNVIRLNNQVITLNYLKDVTKYIGYIHSQMDTYQLMDKQSYLDFVDQIDIDAATQLRNQYLLKRSAYLEAFKQFKNLKQKKDESVERIDFLSYQVKELESLNLVINEKQDLEEKVSKLSNFDKIKQGLTQAYENINHEFFQLDQLYDAFKALNRIKDFDETYEHLGATLETSYYQIEDVMRELKHQLSDFDFDQEAFDGYQERIYELSKIETKYQKEVNDLIAYLEEIKNELEMITDYDGYIKRAQVTVDQAFQEAYQSGIRLHDLRMKLAKRLEKEIIASLIELDLEKANFSIVFEEMHENQELLENGLDTIDFHISLNEGEPLKPLSKVASGGEKARFMLALRSIYAQNENLSLLIFDEIDTGVSGKTASKVAHKMLDVAKERQLLVITHLPQVAARAHQHYAIFKEKKDMRMKTHIQILNEQQRITAIATMLSDDKVTSFAIEQAKLLLKK